MTTQAQSPQSAGGPTAPTTSSKRTFFSALAEMDARQRVQAILQAVRNVPASLRYLWQKQRHWLILGVLLAVIISGPFSWFWDTWTAPDSPLSYQPFIPIGAIWLALLDRQNITDQYRELAMLFPIDSPKRRGKMWLAFLGSILVLISYLLMAPPLAMVALLVMIAGVIYYAYGPYILSALRRPLGFLFMMAPVPNVIVSTSTSSLQLGCATVAGQILHALNPKIITVGTFIQLPNYKLEVAGPCSGISVLFPVLAMTLWLALYKRMRPGTTFILLTVSAVISLIMNVLRIVAMGLVGTINADLAQQLHDTNSALFTALAFYCTFMAAGLIERPWRFPWSKQVPSAEMHFGYYAPLPQTMDTPENVTNKKTKEGENA